MVNDPVSDSHDPLLESLEEEINQPSRCKRNQIIIIGLCSIVLLSLFTLTLVFVATRIQHTSSVTINTTMTKPTTTKQQVSGICVGVSWNPIGDILLKSDYVSSFAVDNDFNIYISNSHLNTLQKWPPGASEPISLFNGHFPATPLFYHSLTDSLYFFYIFNDTQGVYKLVNGSSTPITVFRSNGKGWNLDQLDTNCIGLYVNSVGDVFVLDGGRHRIVKWKADGSSQILIGGRQKEEYISDPFPFPQGFNVDEMNDFAYVITGASGHPTKRFSSGSLYGVTVLGGGPSTVLSDAPGDYIEPQAILVDKMGNILIAENAKVTRWTLDAKYIGIAVGGILGGGATSISFPDRLAFDRLENLYVYDHNDKKLEQEEIFLEAPELKQQSLSKSRWFHSFLSTHHRIFYTILILLLIISGIMAITVICYKTYNKDKSAPTFSTQLRSGSVYRKSKSPEGLGQMKLYIRKPTRDGKRGRFQKLRFPVARYSRREFPFNGPFLSFTPWIPIFADRLTRQTIIFYRQEAVIYILPPLINFYGKMFSVAELIAFDYASLVSSGTQPMNSINMLSYFQPTPLYGAGIPRISSLTGGFVGGIRTDYDAFIIPKYPRTQTVKDIPQQTEEDDDDDDNSAPSYSQNDYKRSRPRQRYRKRPYRRPRRPGISNETAQSYPAVLYIWSGQNSSVENAADFIAVIDFDEDSTSYGHILKIVPLVSDNAKKVGQTGNEPHHASLSSDGRYYISGGMLSFLSNQAEVFVWKVPKNPMDASKFLYALDVPAACPDEFQPIDDGKFLLSMMCNENATSPGDMVIIDVKTRSAKSFLKDASSLIDFNPHGYGIINDKSVFAGDYIDPISLTGTDPANIIFRNTLRYFDSDGTLKRTYQIPFPTEPDAFSGIGQGDGFMEIKAIPNDPFGRSYAAVNNYQKRISACIMSFFPDGKRVLMTFQMRFVLLFDISKPEKPVILHVFDFCSDKALDHVQIQVPDSDEVSTFPQFCAKNNKRTGAHIIHHPKGENQFIVVNYFLHFGLAQFSGTRTVHAFKLNKDLTKFEYDHKFNPNFQLDDSEQRLTFHSLHAFPHHAQYIRLNK
ncbi:unnamed protein product [Adineta steineri]|uniref:Uncharacterized protein n=1 Tax=Adineta steineri TaxID=433720 RepID=A0A815BDG9_9BILA|nr:unnamed protein product [Adineta steineri]